MLIDRNLTLEIKLLFSIPEPRIAATRIAEDQELGNEGTLLRASVM